MNSESKKIQMQPVRFTQIEKDYVVQVIVHVLHSLEMDFKVITECSNFWNMPSASFSCKNASTCNIYVLRETAGR